jgi:NADP-dependent 3-hydroxy acid dehydrogenase YdfG
MNQKLNGTVAIVTGASSGIRLDILVNYAGLMLLGHVANTDVEEWERMISINQLGLIAR